MPEQKFSALIADDVAALRNLLRLALEGSGRFVVTAQASTGREAVDRSAQHQPDLVLLDLSMPEMDGLEALPLVLVGSPNSRVVVLSGFNHVRMGPIAMRLGASAYLEKGLDPSEMVARLLKILETPLQSEAMQPSDENLPKQPSKTAIERGGLGAMAMPMKVLLLTATAAPSIEQALHEATVANFVPFHCRTMKEAAATLAVGGVDLVLVDPASLPGNPESALIELLTLASTTPVVALLRDETTLPAPMALRLGVEDCLSLQGIDSRVLGRSLMYALERRKVHETRLLARDQLSELRRLRELEALKAQFFNAAAHELGTPLTPMRLQIHLLKSIQHHPTNPVEQRSLEILDRNIERLCNLTKELLDVARLQSGHLKIEKLPLDVQDVVREVADSLGPVAVNQGVALSWSCPQASIVDADRKGLVQVLYNLVHNALKFTPNGGKVSIEGSSNATELTVRVRDSGIGLRPDQVKRLFRPFSQVLDDAQPTGLGSGLGLFISRGLVELQGGRIWCESQGVGQGSTFALALPLPVSTMIPATAAPTVGA